MRDPTDNENPGNFDQQRSVPMKETSRNTTTNIYDRTSHSKVKKIKLLRNGDRYYGGMTYAVSSDRYRTLDSLLADVTSSAVCDKNILPKGVRYLFNLEGGSRVETLDDLVDGRAYVCSSTNNFNNKILYQASEIPAWNTNAYTTNQSYYSSSLPCSPLISRRGHLHCHLKNVSRDASIVESLDEADTEFVRPKLITVFKNGSKPRRAAKVLLNKRTAHSMEQAMDEINQAIKLDSGAVKKIFAMNGKQITCLQDFFNDDVIFFAFGNEKPSADNFVLTPSELQFVAPTNKMLKFQQLSLNSPQLKKKNWTNPADKTLHKSRDNSFDTDRQTPASSNGARCLSNGNGHDSAKDCSESQPSSLRVKYKLGKVIGEGKFAVVRECTEKARKIPFALKMISKTKVKDDYAALKNEVAILRRVKHENIVQLVEEYETPTHHYLIFELVNGGDLFELISQMSNYSEQDANCMVRDICKGVSSLHQLNIVHRDIKPENILVHKGKPDQKILKLADMGLATYATEPLFTVCGTPTYVAPEVIAEVGYGLKVDIWSIGVLTYILLCGFPPFSSDIDDQDELFDKILEGKFDFVSPHWDDVSDEAKELIRNMLCLDVSKRPTADELLTNPWIMQGSPGTNQKLDQSVSNKIVELHKQHKSLEHNNSSSAMTNTALDKNRYFEGRKQGGCDSPRPDQSHSD